MDDYMIGSGAILTAGPRATVTPATLHAQTDPLLAGVVRAAAIDYEGRRQSDLARLLLVAIGWNARRFAQGVVAPLITAGESSLADVLGTLGRAAGERVVHLFADWLPDSDLVEALNKQGVELVAHPLETIRRAALISGQRHTHLIPLLRAA
jgi:hypothetical protein